MKKLLLVAASSALLSTAAYANEDAFYLRADVGVSHFMSEKDSSTKLKLKTDHSPLMSIAAGYGVMDTVRAELELGYHFQPELSKTGNYSNNTLSAKAKHKVRTTSLMVKGLVDLFDAGPAKLFAGAGIGMAQVSEKVSLTERKVIATNTASADLNYKVKNKNNLAYTLVAGAGFEVSNGVMLDLTYSYNSYGKTKSQKVSDVEYGKTRLHGHVGKIGLRFNI
ncbi:MAG: adhesin [Rickettsiaceae bacterium]|jgi:opacity protein-like surface antigen|nr:adhesin [Rickettsiaceae bacterium]